MRAVVQRVASASVEVDGTVVGRIGKGLLVYVAVGAGDSESDAAYVADKVRHLRIFSDEAGKMNLDVVQAGGQVLVVSAFTVHADARKGRRPSFDAAARGTEAESLYEAVVEKLRAGGLEVQTGRFGAPMQVFSVNDGPICLLLDSRRIF